MLLQSKEYAIGQIRSVYPGLKWGKGLSAINHQIWELIEKVERENRLLDRATLPIMVVVGWAGNDVHGDFGYQGCTWIHQTNLARSEADRKVAAEYVDKQYKKVQRSLEGLVEISKDPVSCLCKSSGTVTIPDTHCRHLTTVRWASTSIGWQSVAFNV